jgi:CBS-domain-containing membrane protein
MTVNNHVDPHATLTATGSPLSSSLPASSPLTSAAVPPSPSSPSSSDPPVPAMPRPALRGVLPAALRSGLGGFAAVLLCASLGSLSHIALLMAPFGATCVLAFTLPDSPLAQPRNIVGGHLLSTAIGLLTLAAFGSHAWSLAFAVGLAIAAMQLTRTVHPPAGADPLLVMLSGAGWSFLLTPVLAGTVLIVAVAWLYHRLTRSSSIDRRYPKQWL